MQYLVLCIHMNFSSNTLYVKWIYAIFESFLGSIISMFDITPKIDNANLCYLNVEMVRRTEERKFSHLLFHSPHKSFPIFYATVLPWKKDKTAWLLLESEFANFSYTSKDKGTHNAKNYSTLNLIYWFINFYYQYLLFTRYNFLSL